DVPGGQVQGAGRLGPWCAGGRGGEAASGQVKAGRTGMGGQLDAGGVAIDALGRPARTFGRPGERAVVEAPLVELAVDGVAKRRAEARIPGEGCLEVALAGELASVNRGVRAVAGETLHEVRPDVDGRQPDGRCGSAAPPPAAR